MAGLGWMDEYGWDAEGELVSAGDAGFVYDADGNRLVREDAGGTTVYLGGQEVLIKPGGAVSVTRYYSFAGKTVAVRTGRGLGDAVTSLVADHHGTPVAAVPNTGHPVRTPVARLYTDPFGGRRGVSGAGTVPGDVQFLGKVRDESSGLTLLGARYYDEVVGGFVSVDPILDLMDPQQWNGYAYAGSNPVTLSDPTGLLTGMLIDDGRPGKSKSASSAGKAVGKTSSSVARPTGGSSGGPGVGEMARAFGTALGVVGVSMAVAAYPFIADTVNGLASLGNAMIRNPWETAGLLIGAMMIWGGAAGMAGGGAACATGVGCVAGAPAIAGSAALAGAGAAAAGASGISLIHHAQTDNRVQVMNRDANSGADDAGALTSAERRTLDDALRPGKLDHVLAPKHNFDPLVKQFGSRSAAMEEIVRSIGGPLPASGAFEISRSVAGQTVVIRGAVVNGTPRIGTAFIP